LTERKPSVLFVHNAYARFVQLDLQMLSDHFQVLDYYLKDWKVSALQTFEMVRRHDLVFGWFASWHTFLPILLAKALGKPSILVVGGYDTANLPELNYGSQRGGLKKWVSRWTMKCADRLLAFSEYSKWEAIKYAGVDQDKISRLYLGVPDLTGSHNGNRNKIGALTVGNIEWLNLKRKGHEPFVRSASLLQDIPFQLVGKWKDEAVDYLKGIASPNVQFTGWVSEDELMEHYKRSAVYVQASQHEGFGLSLAEAMLAGCIPVVTRAGSLPEVVGDCGIYIDSPTPENIAAGIKRALQTGDTRLREKARQRIVENFSIEKRRDGLHNLIQEICC
jgi:glycosyltransferase involved in cell wall biosynthesis